MFNCAKDVAIDKLTLTRAESGSLEQRMTLIKINICKGFTVSLKGFTFSIDDLDFLFDYKMADKQNLIEAWIITNNHNT